MEAAAGGTCAAQQYNLKWTNHTNNILEMFSEQLLNGLLVDVTLFCDGQFIRAHKMVLSACSPYFQELFNVHKVDHPVIFMNGVRFIAVKQMVEFMYQGEIKVSDEDLDQLLAIAESLQIKGLCKIKRENNDGDTSSTLAKKEDLYQESAVKSGAAMPKRRKRRKLSHSPAAAIDDAQTNGDYSGASQSTESFEDTRAVNRTTPIRRPKNAFMIFAGEWRKKLAKEHKGESNKEISMRLGLMWKGLSANEKDEYFLAAKKVVEDHRLKYPDYHLAREAKRRSRNPRQVKRKKNSVEDIPEEVSNWTKPEPIDPADTTDTTDKEVHDNIPIPDIKVETDESNLVIAESQCGDSSGENSVSSRI